MGQHSLYTNEVKPFFMDRKVKNETVLGFYLHLNSLKSENKHNYFTEMKSFSNE